MNDLTLTVGGYDQGKYSNEEVSWFDIFDDEWSIGLNFVQVNEDLVRLDDVLALVDSGSSYLMLP